MSIFMIDKVEWLVIAGIAMSTFGAVKLYRTIGPYSSSDAEKGTPFTLIDPRLAREGVRHIILGFIAQLLAVLI